MKREGFNPNSKKFIFAITKDEILADKIISVLKTYIHENNLDAFVFFERDLISSQMEISK